MRTHEQIIISEFKGKWARGESEACPPDHSPDEKNCQFGFKSVKSRPQFATYIDVGANSADRVGDSIIRIHTYLIAAYVDSVFHPAEVRLLVWFKSGKLFDNTIGFSNVQAIYDFGGPVTGICDDFSVLNMNNRAYISFHFREFGDAFIPMQVYDFADSANKTRNALGLKPASAITTVTEPIAGHVDAGQYVTAVAFETKSGFITPPQAVANRTVFTASGAKNMQFNGIPTGPAGTIGRYLLSSKVFPTVTGDIDLYELFFIPGGHITDNTTTVKANNFYSTDLVSSAEYLKTLQETQCSVLGMCEYNGRMILWGDPNFPNTIRGSGVGKPENFSTVDSSLTISVNSIGQARRCVSFRGNLMVHLNNSTKVTRDTGAEPANWSIVDIDNGIGTEIYGTGEIYYGDGGSADSYIIAHRSGIYIFNGVIQKPALTYKIADFWANQVSAFFNRCQVKVDPVNKAIYVTYFVLENSVFIPRILYGDYSEGLDSTHIKWSEWHYYENLDLSQILANPPFMNWIQIILGTSFDVKVLVPDQAKYNIGIIGASTVAQSQAEYFISRYSTAYFGNNLDGDDGIYHLASIRARISNEFASTEADQCVNIKIVNLQEQATTDLGNAVLAAKNVATKYYSDIEFLSNFKDEAFSVKFTTVMESYLGKNVPSTFELQKVRLYAKKIYNFRPLMRYIPCAAANVAPVLTVPGAQSAPNGVNIVFSTPNNNLITMSDVDANGGIEQLDMITTQFSGSFGAGAQLNIVLASLTGITITAGVDHTPAMTIQGTLTNINNALNGLTFTNVGRQDGQVYNFTLTANDLGNTGSGGALTDIKIIAITLHVSGL